MVRHGLVWKRIILPTCVLRNLPLCGLAGQKPSTTKNAYSHELGPRAGSAQFVCVLRKTVLGTFLTNPIFENILLDPMCKTRGLSDALIGVEIVSE